MTGNIAVAEVPRPTEAGPEMADLARFFFDSMWIGTVVRNGMGPGTPEMMACGRGWHASIQAGRWIVGTYQQDQFAPDGSRVLTWELHWVVGWSPPASEYRATFADNYGRADVMRGHIDGDRLVFETIGEPPSRVRLVWDMTDPADVTWRNDVSIERGPWSLVEEYHLTALPQQRPHLVNREV